MEARERLEVAGRSDRRIGDLPGWLLLFAGALVVRSLRVGLVATPSGVRFPSGADELYHMRRIWFTVVNFPAVLDFDRYMNHPEGAPPIWTACFDWTIAAVARLLVGAGDQAAVERVAIWAPPVLGALGVLAAAWLARRTFSAAAGWVTGAWLALLPAHVVYGSIGEIDHHVAVGLFVTFLVAAAMRLTRSVAASWREVAACGLTIAAALLLWPGSLLQVGVVQAAWTIQLLATQEREQARSRARSLAAVHVLAAALVAPFCTPRRWPELGTVTPLVLSGFQPLWLGAGAVVFALLASLWGRTPLGATRTRRIGTALGIAALGLATAWLGVPGLAPAIRDAAGWFRPDPFLGVVAELRPLLLQDGRFHPALAHHHFSYGFWAFPLGAALLVRRALREGRADVLLLVGWASALFAATLYQQRFMDSASIGFVLVLGPAIVLVFRDAWRHFAGALAALVGAATTLAGVAALLPYAPAYRGDWQGSLAEQRGDRLFYSSFLRERRVLERVARGLRAASPRTAGYLDPSERPAYGVLAAWGHGHLLRYYSERPMVQDNFGPWGGRQGFESAEAYYESLDEEEAFAIASRLRARYVVAAPQGSGHHWPRRGSLARRLALRRDGRGGLAFPVSGERALSRHRLVLVADDADFARAGAKPWTVAFYEIVPGARVTGTAPAGERVRFELPVALPERRPLRYVASTRADAAGRYEIRLPYPSANERPYMVRAGSQTASLALSEADVRKGRTVAGPSFRERALPSS